MDHAEKLFLLCPVIISQVCNRYESAVIPCGFIPEGIHIKGIHAIEEPCGQVGLEEHFHMCQAGIGEAGIEVIHAVNRVISLESCDPCAADIVKVMQGEAVEIVGVIGNGCSIVDVQEGVEALGVGCGYKEAEDDQEEDCRTVRL
jgi:hypothetical protein